MGVRLFMMPVTELSSSVCARAKRNAGKNIPISPEANSFTYWDDCRSLSLNRAIGARKTDAAATLRDPSSPAEKTSRPRFMRMKEVPQIKARSINRVNARPLLLAAYGMDQICSGKDVEKLILGCDNT